MRLTVSLFSARTDLLCTLDLAQDIELKRKNVLHGSGARFLSAVHTSLLIMEAQVGQLQAQLAQTQAELQYAIEQIRILTIQVNNSASAAASAATATAQSTTTAPADAPTGSHSQTPKVNYQFGKDIIPSIFDGKQRTDLISGNGQKIQLCTYQHNVLMRAKSFWSGWSWRGSTWRKQQFEQPCVSKPFELWILVCVHASVSSLVFQTRLDGVSWSVCKHQSPALPDSSPVVKHIWIMVACLCPRICQQPFVSNTFDCGCLFACPPTDTKMNV